MCKIQYFLWKNSFGWKGINKHNSCGSEKYDCIFLVDWIDPLSFSTRHCQSCTFMHYYVQMEFKSIFRFIYKKVHTTKEEEYICSHSSWGVSESCLWTEFIFGQVAIIINHPEQPEHSGVWSVECLSSSRVWKQGSVIVSKHWGELLWVQMQTGQMAKGVLENYIG